MKDLTKIHNDQTEKPKSISDMTPFELSEIDRYQNRNRGFYDNNDEDLEVSDL